MFKLYGVPLSQPFRAVAWTMLQLEIPFHVQVAVPGATSKIGTLHDEFRRLTPHQATHVPLLQMIDGDLTLSESPAILMYLCERQRQQQQQKSLLNLYPSPSVAPYGKAQVDSYLHWHHENTRQLCKLFWEKIRPDTNHVVTKEDWHEMKRILTALETGWLKNGSPEDNHSNYIGRSNHPTIADILCYEELIPLTMCNLLPLSVEDQYPTIHQWMTAMSRLPHHEAVHRALTVLGDLSSHPTNDDDNNSPNSLPSLDRRLSAATKAGLQGLADAQASFGRSSPPI